ncbi:UDP-N-acetylmuramate:L-alanyl-gamma-D-glutamyl-meso-diaminopimelate ligase [Allofrancisella guangzhouensis]|uniref:UDP-N-acetylmuramate:L-alanyl-gamma-D-glutamyl-meso-diaminopimelate ligase n=1 Tax=Allofrancisella guangzhouensis TaxID=594679 RepID=A0A0A8E5D7_9GAMM|nr:UDP-N-acetylmuramate:L-alanyl-gamma-D-glutamyl-meso-diaminopimelate ligase [Allofrancisella guangzhouensis]AJC49213.1 UDP-N-acetylmuramate:L-alanyl-gamma-D-glutamyl-meso-diaminopimelate ligase [Allofrancisella guangzhouensis]MBK2027589.1 UDP-N-acetylmuramate:L-alanyl-gamma-D-glutamyl-meso-diaminopimelate ligase [Allofrancisella guangzhouensis]MBK2044820.1 UDP-N-acetylmuramate:L-alanyl-gamma-D-glutamyl-meso-diaminopimelate ligase [Allofrancisella guangzhouensis]MBK2045024.1 UDP-N-acetylmurama
MSKHIHILGICGTFMGSLAILAKQKGYKVTGSDTNVYPPMSTYLESQAIEIIQGFDCSQLETKPDEIIIGNVMKRGLPIIEKILDEKLNYFSGPEWLYHNILKQKKVIAIAGTHGKTTTTTMTIKILEQAGFNPSFLVGGISGDFGVSSRYTDSEYFVIEADEYDTAFFDKRSKLIHYDPSILVINNIEYDHADIFKDIDAIYWQFHQLIRKMPASASIIYNASDVNVQHIMDMGYWSNTIAANSKLGFYITEYSNDYSKFMLGSNSSDKVEISWNFIGEHNALNALSAYAVAKQLDISNNDIKQALESFKGVKRRLEVLCKREGIVLYDDFAHHPTSIKLTLEAVRNKNPQAYIIALIDPRSNTMKQGNNKESLPNAILKADKVLLYDHALLKWDANELLKDSTKVDFIKNIEEFISTVESLLITQEDREVEIVMMSNGSFDGLREKLIEFLES